MTLHGPNRPYCNSVLLGGISVTAANPFDSTLASLDDTQTYRPFRSASNRGFPRKRLTVWMVRFVHSGELIIDPRIDCLEDSYSSQMGPGTQKVVYRSYHERQGNLKVVIPCPRLKGRCARDRNARPQLSQLSQHSASSFPDVSQLGTQFLHLLYAGRKA